MALIAVAADKGAPGVTTTALALAAVWPRPVLLAECDPAGGDLVYRLPAADGGRLDPRRGLLSLAVAARRGLQPHQAWEHTQKLNGGLDVLAGVTNAEQGAGLNLLWGPVGRVLAGNAQADVIADCGRLGVDGPHYDLLAEAALVVLVTRPSLGEVVRLRDRVAAVTAAIGKRGRPGAGTDVVVIADYKQLKTAAGEIGHALGQVNVPARIAGGLADDPRGAELLRGEWGGKLDKSLLIRTARDIAEHLASRLPSMPQDGPAGGQAQAGAAEPQESPSTWAAEPGARNAAARAGYPPEPAAGRMPPSVPHEATAAQAARIPLGTGSPQAARALEPASYEHPARPAQPLPAAAPVPADDRAARGRHAGEPSNGQQGR
ncbi:MAG TPA: hypothetical protein VE733_13725 [Streptosporangiaceae bacterium]|jgi:hypothetical protein|nr:hypothetical protein [Streptosporangiaceae bacterium]